MSAAKAALVNAPAAVLHELRLFFVALHVAKTGIGGNLKLGKLVDSLGESFDDFRV